MSAHVSCCIKLSDEAHPHIYEENLQSLLAFLKKSQQGEKINEVLVHVYKYYLKFSALYRLYYHKMWGDLDVDSLYCYYEKNSLSIALIKCFSGIIIIAKC